jgi:hypothetical protein
MFQIDLAATGNLQLHMPNRCAVEIPATIGGLEFIKKIIFDHHRGLKNQRGYIGTLPTQHAVDKAFADDFLEQKRKKTAETRTAELKAKLDIDWDRLEINI